MQPNDEYINNSNWMLKFFERNYTLITFGFKSTIRSAKRTTENCHCQLVNVTWCPEFIILCKFYYPTCKSFALTKVVYNYVKSVKNLKTMTTNCITHSYYQFLQSSSFPSSFVSVLLFAVRLFQMASDKTPDQIK